MCLFCKRYYEEKLTRHIKNAHKEHERAKSAMKLPPKERQDAFDGMRKEGILMANQEQMKEATPLYERERRTGNEDPLVICGLCKGFYSKISFSRHKVRCKGDGCSEACSVPLSLLSQVSDVSQGMSSFDQEILCRFRRDDVGQLCFSDPVIKAVGKRMWAKEKKKEDKKTEVRRSVMASMRRLASLYLCFKEQHKIHGTDELERGNARDMFDRKHFLSLSEAITNYTTDEGCSTLKAGLKMGMYYLLKKACKIIKGTHLIEEKDGEASEIDNFVAVLELNHDFIFGDATYKINNNRQRNLRKPAALPLEDDVNKLRNYTLENIASLTSDSYKVWDSGSFKKLRDLTVSRLTLFNARRGGEPSRLTLVEWKEANEDAWIDKEKADTVMNDPLDKLLLQTLKVAYQTGKGNNHLVPVLFPSDCFEAMKVLSDAEARTSAGVTETNVYVFACTQASSNHVTGWHAINSICSEADISCKSRMTATRNRHRISTLYASMDLPESDRVLFFKHMGHSHAINENIYQAPPALMEVLRIGKHLNHIDKGSMPHGSKETASEESLEAELGQIKDRLETSSSSEDVNTPQEASAEDTQLRRRSISQRSESFKANTRTTARKGRTYTKWSKAAEDSLKKYFNDIISGTATKTIPGKPEVVAFLETHQLSETYAWKTVRTKVMNERVKLHRRVNKRMESMEVKGAKK